MEPPISTPPYSVLLDANTTRNTQSLPVKVANQQDPNLSIYSVSSRIISSGKNVALVTVAPFLLYSVVRVM